MDPSVDQLWRGKRAMEYHQMRCAALAFTFQHHNDQFNLSYRIKQKSRSPTNLDLIVNI